MICKSFAVLTMALQLESLLFFTMAAIAALILIFAVTVAAINLANA